MLVSGLLDGPFGQAQLLGHSARKQPHVCRSTFAAELHAALGAVSEGMVIQVAFAELHFGVRSAGKLLEMQDRGELHPVLQLCIDARLVLDAVSAP